METIATHILNLEKAALEKWNNGDPSGYLDLSANDVVYFDPFHEKRITGKAALTTYYESLRGKIFVDRNEWIEPMVQVCGSVAVLTFNINSFVKDVVYKWNCTEVYRNDDNEWKLIQTHWSFVQPKQS